jgi:hypothetical protein
LSPIDGGGSGVAATQYRLQGTSTWLATASNAFAVPARAGGANDGSWVYEYQALDNAGNVSLTGSCVVRIDTTPATSTATGLAADPLTGWTTTDRSVTLSADDGSGAGVATIRYTVDGGSEKVYSGPFTVAGAGQHQVDYWSLDIAGNLEDRRSGWVNIASFYAEANGLAPDTDSGWRNTDATVTIAPGGGPGPLTVSLPGRRRRLADRRQRELQRVGCGSPHGGLLRDQRRRPDLASPDRLREHRDYSAGHREKRCSVGVAEDRPDRDADTQ